MQVKFSAYGQTGDLGVRSKGQISFTKSISKNFISNFVFSQNKGIKHMAYRSEFSLCDLGLAAEVGL